MIEYNDGPLRKAVVGRAWSGDAATWTYPRQARREAVGPCDYGVTVAKVAYGKSPDDALLLEADIARAAGMVFRDALGQGMTDATETRSSGSFSTPTDC